jgi:hypothetical protein
VHIHLYLGTCMQWHEICIFRSTYINLSGEIFWEEMYQKERRCKSPEDESLTFINLLQGRVCLFVYSSLRIWSWPCRQNKTNTSEAQLRQGYFRIFGMCAYAPTLVTRFSDWFSRSNAQLKLNALLKVGMAYLFIRYPGYCGKHRKGENRKKYIHMFADTKNSKTNYQLQTSKNSPSPNRVSYIHTCRRILIYYFRDASIVSKFHRIKYRGIIKMQPLHMYK